MKHLLFAALLAAYPLQAVAQAPDLLQLRIPCYEGKSYLEMLARDYHEVLTDSGLSKNGDLVQIYASPEHTFTVMRIMPSGTMCMISSGENWQAEKPSVAGSNL